MTAESTRQQLKTGQSLFASYAFPPNELGYCGPPDADAAALADHAREFDGAWPYLQAIADAVGADPLDEQIVRNYWVGGPLLDTVDARVLLKRLREAFSGQVTGLLNEVESIDALAHHSFHVFVVYPWVRFLDRDPTTPVKVLQDCRIRWGTVESVRHEHAELASRPLVFDDGVLALGEPVVERVRWQKDGQSLGPPPRPGQTVSAHWDWVCGSLTDAEASALSVATQATLDVVNAARNRHST